MSFFVHLSFPANSHQFHFSCSEKDFSIFSGIFKKEERTEQKQEKEHDIYVRLPNRIRQRKDRTTMNNNPEYLKENAVAILQSEIKKKREQIDLIKGIDVRQPISEKVWHELCETPIRNSDLLKIIVHTMWPNAEKIVLGANCVRFELYSFTVSIPTSRCMGVEIVSDLTFDYFGEKEPAFKPSAETKRMLEYLEKKDTETDWYTLFRLKVPEEILNAKYRKWYAWYLWQRKYKNMKIDEEEWKEKYDHEKKEYEKKVEEYYVHQEELFQKCVVLIEKVIPEIRRFSSDIRLPEWCTMKDVQELYESRKVFVA